jgi:hypothetical protein
MVMFAAGLSELSQKKRPKTALLKPEPEKAYAASVAFSCTGPES